MSTAQEVIIPEKRRVLEPLTFILLQALLFLTPTFFVPMALVPFQTGKSVFIILGIASVFILWLVARFKDGIFSIPKGLFYASTGVLALTYLLATVFSGNWSASFAGRGFEFGTLSFFLASLVLFALVPIFVRSKERIFYSYTTLLAAFFVITIFHGARFILGPQALSFGVFSTATANLVGSWNDLGIFFGLAATVSFITLEKVTLNVVFRILVNLCFALSMIMLMVVNFSTLWITVALTSLAFAVYEFFVRVRKGRILAQRVPYRALVAFLVSTLFIFAGTYLGGIISSKLGTSQAEVHPSLASTIEVAKSTLADKPWFGVGPNRFSSEWLLHKPDGVNDTVFWNVDFDYGVGFVPSLVTTTGIVGTLAMLLFCVLFIASAFRAFLKRGASLFSRYLVVSSFAGAAYLWVFSFFYVPSSSIWILTLFMSGLFVASLREDKVIGSVSVDTSERPVANFISTFFVTLGLVCSLAFIYFVAVRYVAAIYFQKAFVAVTVNGDASAGQYYLLKAASLAPIDAYSQALSQVYVSRIQALLAHTKVSKDDTQKLFQQYLSGAIGSAQQAISVDSTNYANYVTLGRVLESVVSLKIQGAYEASKQAYESARTLNPQNPELYLDLARIEVANGNNAAARVQISKALDQKADYAAALYLLSQIQISEKDVVGGIRSVEALAVLSPSDSGVFFQLGLLYYDQKRYPDAVLAFGRALNIDPQYANAKYFLGLSYYQVGEGSKSPKLFQELLISNPGDAGLQAIIANLQAGKAPLAPAKTVKVNSKSKKTN